MANPITQPCTLINPERQISWCINETFLENIARLHTVCAISNVREVDPNENQWRL
jgi:hypothetical protein